MGFSGDRLSDRQGRRKDNPHMRFHRALAVPLLCAVLASCSPTFNWREVRLEPSPLIALLPCKPDRGERDVPLAGRSVRLSMRGCEAGGLLFAVAWTDLGDASAVEAVLTEWRATTLANLQAGPATAAPFTPVGGHAGTASTRVSASARATDGSALQARGAWFASGSMVFQALILGPMPDAEVVDAFFAGLRLP